MKTQAQLAQYRADVTEALFQRLKSADWLSPIIGTFQEFRETGKRIKLFNAPQNKPSMFLCKTGEVFTPRSSTPPIRVLKFDIIIYHDTAGAYPDAAPSDESDAIMSAIEFELQAKPTDAGWPERCTLGTLVHAVTLDGEAQMDHGDLDGEGMIRIPIRVTLP